MKPEKKSQLLLGVTEAQAKMYEYSVSKDYHIKITQDPAKLLTLTIGLLGDLSAAINRDELPDEFFAESQKNLLFSARFFDAYLQSQLDETLDFYLILLGSASYYLCNLPGSATVLANRINLESLDLDCDGLDVLLLWLLQTASIATHLKGYQGLFGDYIDSISKCYLQFFLDGTGERKLIELAVQLRTAVYEAGTPQQLLLGDVVSAVIKRKLQNSCWKSLPLYSDLPKNKWQYAIQKNSFIKELWPAQHLLGQADVLKGKSAIVQMPTSAGKTKAIELIIRSAFLAERILLAIIIAPFRALCQEIKNSLVLAYLNESTKIDELTDAPQTDFEIAELLGHQQIIVVTPEKLLYVLRHTPELANHIGLIVFDEGHQFDSGTRGITYELLLTSLRALLSEKTQKILISAVISNAESLGEWLNGDPKTVNGQNLFPTHRSLAFASFIDLKRTPLKTGWMKYVHPESPDTLEYFVPQVIEKVKLERKKGESLTKIKYFPNQAEGKEIAIFLGLRLVSKGAVAIFCGRKDTASRLCEMVSEKFSRHISIATPKEYSNKDEISKLNYLIEQNLGANTPAAFSAKIGIFSHHGNTPHGIRLAVEHAMREDLVRFVVCTSTLAQGVNLPIRYLIVTSVYQGIERIKVRDFHNLIGRAGRAGMHTEGSILFADPIVYDKRKSNNENWRWKQVKELLEPSNTEPCISNLLSIFDEIKSDDGKFKIIMDALSFAVDYIQDPDKVSNFAGEIASKHKSKGFTKTGVERQVSWRINLISAIESFLLSQWDVSEDPFSESDVIDLAEQTLAFFLADEEKREHIRKLFKLLAVNISTNIPEPNRRRVYGKTLYGVREAQFIEEWVHSNTDQLFSILNVEEIFYLVWPLLFEHVHNGLFKKIDKPEVLKEISQDWIEGKPFHDLLETIHQREAKMSWGTQWRDFKIDHMVDLCEGGLAYDGTLLIGALCEFVAVLDKEGLVDLISLLQLFQKRLKYGLPTETTIALYELGFSDRVISQDLALTMNLNVSRKKDVVNALKQNQNVAIAVIEKYPIYFQEKLNELLHL